MEGGLSESDKRWIKDEIRAQLDNKFGIEPSTAYKKWIKDEIKYEWEQIMKPWVKEEVSQKVRTLH